MHSTWYTTLRYLPHTRAYQTCIVSTNCTGTVERGHHSCHECRGLLRDTQHTFRSALDRTQRSQEPSPMLPLYKALRAQLTNARKKNKRLRKTIAQGIAAAIRKEGGIAMLSPLEKLREFTRRANVQGVLQTLVDSAAVVSQKCSKTIKVAMNFAVNIIRNCILPPGARRGRKCNHETEKLCTAVRLAGGESVYTRLAQTLGLPHERTIRKKVKKNEEEVIFSYGITEDNFITLRKVYTKAMNNHKIPLGSVPCSMAEDETAVIKEHSWDCVKDTLTSTCGKHCENKCKTKKECKAAGCINKHQCMALESNPVIVGHGPTSFEAMKSFVEQNKAAPYLRLVLINPHHYSLPRLPCVLVGTCLTFSAYHYVLPQWELLARWYNKHLLHVLGPLIGRSSDGDSRRRLAFFERSVPRSLDSAERYTIDAASFTYSGTITQHGIMLDCDEDYKHNFKKLINVLASNSKTLLIGSNTFNLAMLAVVVSSFHASEHGLLQNDLDRAGWSAMDVPSAQRLTSQKVLDSLSKLIEGNEENGPQPMLKGLRRHLAVARRYLSIFYDNDQSIEQRIVSAAYVATYLRLWRLWCRHTADVTVKKNFITEEGFRDVLLSVHFVVLLIRLYSERHPDNDILFDLLGTDACEDFFSSLGSWIRNKRTYTIQDAVQSTRSMLVLALICADGSVFPEKKNKHRHLGMNGARPAQANEERHNETKPNHAQIIVLWLKGVEEARADATTDGFKPRPERRRGALPEWWTHPEKFDPKTCSDLASEEDLLAASAQNSDQHRPDDVDDPDADNGEPDDNDDDDATAYLAEGKEPAVDGPNEHGMAFPEPNSSTSDDEPLSQVATRQATSRRTHAVDAEHENKNALPGQDGSSSDDTPLVQHPSRRPQAPSEPNLHQNTAECDVLDLAMDAVVANGCNPSIIPTVYVPSIGKRVHKLRAMKWLNGGRGTISADRELRVRSAHQQNGQNAMEGHHEFNLARDDWCVGMFSDVAVLMEATGNQRRDTVSIGRIIRMRKKSGNRYTAYRRPVIIHEDRETMGNLLFTLYLYKRYYGGGRTQKRFKLNSNETEEVEVKSVICPAVLKFNNIGKYYVLDRTTDDVITRQLRGNVEWDASRHPLAQNP